MRQRTEHKLGVLEPRVFGSDKRHRPAGEFHILSPLSVGRGEHQIESRMPLRKYAQLSARIPTGSQNPNRNFMHR